MTITDDLRPRSFRIGRVLGDSFSVFSRNVGLCLGLALIFSALPAFLVQWWQFSSIDFLGTDSAPDLERFGWSYAFVSIIGGIVSFVLSSLLQAGLTRASIEDLNGERPSFGDCLRTATSVLFPVLGIAILVMLGAVLGMILLIVPGVYLWLRWSVSVPVQVNERRGVLGSMSRSSELTKGSLWAIFGLYIVLFILIYAISIAIGFFSVLILTTFGAVLGSMAIALASTIYTIAISIIGAVAYVELRLVKEGTDVKDLAEIFA